MGPQIPDAEKSHATSTQEAHPSHSTTPIIPDYLPYPPLQQIGGDKVSRAPPPRLYQQVVG